MLRFVCKNMLIKKMRVLLVALSIIVSATVALVSFNVSCQVNEGIVSTAGYYDLIIGPAGSATQLAMNTMFFTDEPLGTIDYHYAEEIQKSGLANSVVPFTMGDSFNAAKIVGTTAEFLNGKSLRTGEMFDETFEAVVGSAVAKQYGLSVGDAMITSHGLTGTGHAHEKSPLTVTGILDKTGTAFDNVIFTSVETVWSVHDHAHEEDAGGSGAAADAGKDAHSHSHTQEKLDSGKTETTEHIEDNGHFSGGVCAILVRSKSFSDYYTLMELYSENASLLVINPSTVLREVLESVDLSTEIVYLLCAVILVMNLVVISVITLLNMYDAEKEIALMRLIGISMKKIGQVYLIENSLVGLASALLALISAHALLHLMGGFVASMGIVLTAGKLYRQEWLILLFVLIISILPTMLRIFAMAKKDSLRV